MGPGVGELKREEGLGKLLYFLYALHQFFSISFFTLKDSATSSAIIFQQNKLNYRHIFNPRRVNSSSTAGPVCFPDSPRAAVCLAPLLQPWCCVAHGTRTLMPPCSQTAPCPWSHCPRLTFPPHHREELPVRGFLPGEQPKTMTVDLNTCPC